MLLGKSWRREAANEAPPSSPPSSSSLPSPSQAVRPKGEGVVDFSGVWRQTKCENADGYLTALGYSYVSRKVALPFMARSVDVVSHENDRDEGRQQMIVTTSNFHGQWTRAYALHGAGAESGAYEARTADGQRVKVTSCWEEDPSASGRMIHKSKTEGAMQGTLESWRWLVEGVDGAKTMVVKSIVYPKAGRAGTEPSPPSSSPPSSMLWHFTRVPEPEVPKTLRQFDLKRSASAPCLATAAAAADRDPLACARQEPPSQPPTAAGEGAGEGGEGKSKSARAESYADWSRRVASFGSLEEHALMFGLHSHQD